VVKNCENRLKFDEVIATYRHELVYTYGTRCTIRVRYCVCVSCVPVHAHFCLSVNRTLSDREFRRLEAYVLSILAVCLRHHSLRRLSHMHSTDLRDASRQLRDVNYFYSRAHGLKLHHFRRMNSRRLIGKRGMQYFNTILYYTANFISDSIKSTSIGLY